MQSSSLVAGSPLPSFPIVWLLLPESVAFLDRQRKPGALDAINRILTRFGHESITALTPDTAASAQRSVMDILKPGLIVSTLLITLGYFAHVVSFYFIIKWVPKLVVDMGFAPKAAAGVLTWANVGGAAGVVLFGLIATRVSLKALTLVALRRLVGHGHLVRTRLARSCVAVERRGNRRRVHQLGDRRVLLAVRQGFSDACTRDGHRLRDRRRPRRARLLAPVIAGYLLQAGFGLQAVATMMAMGSLSSAAALLVLKVRATDRE